MMVNKRIHKNCWLVESLPFKKYPRNRTWNLKHTYVQPYQKLNRIHDEEKCGSYSVLGIIDFLFQFNLLYYMFMYDSENVKIK